MEVLSTASWRLGETLEKLLFMLILQQFYLIPELKVSLGPLRISTFETKGVDLAGVSCAYWPCMWRGDTASRPHEREYRMPGGL
jgi:hypothetical protein